MFPHGSNLHGRCNDYRRQLADAEAALRDLFTEYHLDPRDAQALGLW
jgi:hypothetical protein